ncbi:hypothetical protein [Halodesulfovibrio sp. MK-HDV]|jgi:hypothetical protein|uniref:hypothetical protein n=1 Tax=Halodesulfovibrio sp. MK-HDV TaxID=2599925 RepID=UPI00136A40C5|nr:hypothetical protein [Halodesulfovibrio sp. MK-HDV]KAF1073456.1 hypothetical protein MKHDV_03590 [Halodesulfovibrio sp. MK-HDV]
MRNVTISFNGSPVLLAFLNKIENAKFPNGDRQDLPPTLFLGTEDKQWFDSLETGSDHIIEHEGTTYQSRLIGKYPVKELNAFELHFATKFL